MTTKILQQEFLHKRYDNLELLDYTPVVAEPVLDYRGDIPKLNIGDGLVPGGTKLDVFTLEGIVSPEILTPVSGTIDVIRDPVITSSTFFGIIDGDDLDTHVATYWEIATDLGFTNIIHASGRDTGNLTTYDLNLEGVLLEWNTQYFVRARYEGSKGTISGDSSVITFTTSQAPLGISRTLDIVDTFIDNAKTLNISKVYDVSMSGDGNTIAVAVQDNASPGFFENQYDAGILILTKTNNVWGLVDTIENVASNFDSTAFKLDLNYDGTKIVFSEVNQNTHTAMDGSTAYTVYDNWQCIVSVFKLFSGNWIQEAQILNFTGSGGYSAYNNPNGNRFWGGYMNVRMSADGNRILVENYTNSKHKNPTVYQFNGSNWSSNATIFSTYHTNGYSNIRDIDMSSDGNYVVAVGFPYSGYTAQRNIAIYFFNGSSWAKTEEFDVNPEGLEASSVAINSDGSTIVVGCTLSGGVIQMLIYQRSGNGWSRETVIVDDLSGIANRNSYGNRRAAISADGETVAFGFEDQTNTAIAGTLIAKKKDGVWETENFIRSDEHPNYPTVGYEFGDFISMNDLATSLLISAQKSIHVYE